ncbi:hypothetical protein SNOG_05416 [Parastagonospora nodorum SN15]|uniref:Uncharacterized protein n=1 Tax=Phaeosphaeria nodorum (strain SN15 / ATCC MYA-4574 / FGSC 10173) TaxID=321614 RepID=Q0US48_PHANO|nr:hypothetical protein SNOG_05416 [Parastagonospora nodorum SN15]EAT87807.1 hypothetical protein SNOG_05416 [Parastagonospora nodorum SN15]
MASKQKYRELDIGRSASLQRSSTVSPFVTGFSRLMGLASITHRSFL